MAGVIEERFAAFLRPGYFSRVDNQHPLELYIGLDEKGRKAIELRARFTARKVTGTSAIDVNQYKNEKYSTIRFSLCDGLCSRQPRSIGRAFQRDTRASDSTTSQPMRYMVHCR